MPYTPKVGDIVRIASTTENEYRPAIIMKLDDPEHAHLWCFRRADDPVGFIPSPAPGAVHVYKNDAPWTPGTWRELETA